MFDVGFTEILLIAIVALLVLGPERLPRAARFAGLWVRRARAQWDSVRTELERELAAEELKASVERARREAAAIARDMQETGSEVAGSVRAPADDVAAAPSSAPPAPSGATPAASAPDQAPEPAGQSIPLEDIPAPSAPTREGGVP